MMNEQQADYERAIQGDLEAIIGRLLKFQHPTPEEIKLLCWASGVDFETVKRQQEVQHD